MKIRQDNGVTYRISVTYIENDNKLSWPIELGVDYEKNQKG